MYWCKYLILAISASLWSCHNDTLEIVTVGDFNQFVQTTQYITDAERYDWSIVQRDVIHFDILYGVDWRCPTGEYLAYANDPVTQISYNDAAAYAQWANVTIPDYKTYWEIACRDKKPINKGTISILPTDQVNIVGNVWELTTPDALGRIRLAGGSYLCNDDTCNGTDKNRQLYVDPETGNCHIGLAVIR